MLSLSLSLPSPLSLAPSPLSLTWSFMEEKTQATTSLQPVEAEADPGLIIIYDAEAVHDALGQANAPVQQGVDQAESVHNLQEYVYTQVLATPCSESEHCVERISDGNVREYYPQLFHRLPADTYRAIIERLKDMFAYRNTALARWSVNVATLAHAPGSLPPHRPLGALIKVVRGVGLGQVVMEPVLIQRGIFRC